MHLERSSSLQMVNWVKLHHVRPSHFEFKFVPQILYFFPDISTPYWPHKAGDFLRTTIDSMETSCQFVVINFVLYYRVFHDTGHQGSSFRGKVTFFMKPHQFQLSFGYKIRKKRKKYFFVEKPHLAGRFFGTKTKKMCFWHF